MRLKSLFILLIFDIASGEEIFDDNFKSLNVFNSIIIEIESCTNYMNYAVFIVPNANKTKKYSKVFFDIYEEFVKLQEITDDTQNAIKSYCKMQLKYAMLVNVPNFKRSTDGVYRFSHDPGFKKELKILREHEKNYTILKERLLDEKIQKQQSSSANLNKELERVTHVLKYLLCLFSFLLFKYTIDLFYIDEHVTDNGTWREVYQFFMQNISSIIFYIIIVNIPLYLFIFQEA